MRRTAAEVLKRHCRDNGVDPAEALRALQASRGEKRTRIELDPDAFVSPALREAAALAGHHTLPGQRDAVAAAVDRVARVAHRKPRAKKSNSCNACSPW